MLPPVIIAPSIAAFASMIEPFGLVPAVSVPSIVSCLAEPKVRPVMNLTLGLPTWLVFFRGLWLAISAAWPF